MWKNIKLWGTLYTPVREFKDSTPGRMSRLREGLCGTYRIFDLSSPHRIQLVGIMHNLNRYIC